MRPIDLYGASFAVQFFLVGVASTLVVLLVIEVVRMTRRR